MNKLNSMKNSEIASYGSKPIKTTKKLVGSRKCSKLKASEWTNKKFFNNSKSNKNKTTHFSQSAPKATISNK